MPSAEVIDLGGLSSGQYSGAGNCSLTERGTMPVVGFVGSGMSSLFLEVSLDLLCQIVILCLRNLGSV